MLKDKKIIQHVSGAVIVFVVGFACFFSGRYLYQLDYYEWIIFGLFTSWLFLLIKFVRFAKKNNFKSWWIWLSIIFVIHPIEMIAMLAFWSIGGFVR